MKFTLSWLKQFLETTASLNEIVNKLTMLGLEVEEIIDRAAELADFEVAEIIETRPHPDANTLRVCTVKAHSESLDIVCGASNARSGIKVVLAKVGTIIPNGNFKIKQSKIRGIESCGMLCSWDELNIKSNEAGIIELPDELKIGDNITEYLGLDDPVIHINITPNRADALGVYGIARDLAAAGIGKLLEWEISDGNNIDYYSYDKSSTKSLAINQDTQNYLQFNPTLLFATCAINNIQNIQSPKWLKNLLENIGISSISAIVDITNYICYSFGQPMHAYDADKLTGILQTELLTINTKFLALNDKEYELEVGDLVVKDDKEIHCLAGIIGGKKSACDAHTTNIILEAACFERKYITRTGRRLNINTDSRYRFERNVDRTFTLKILNYAVNLILTTCGGIEAGINVSGSDKLPQKMIEFPVDFLPSISGLTLSVEEIIKILTNLGFEITSHSEHMSEYHESPILLIQIPSWRYDVLIKEDIVEEIVRIYGYDKIPMTNLPGILPCKILSPEQRRNMDLKRLLASSGYTEVITWSFMDSKKAQNFTELKEGMTLQNPISSDLNYMRPSIVPNLLGLARNNINRSYKDLSLFELGPIFEIDQVMPVKSLAGIRIGANAPKNPHIITKNFNVFDIKLDVSSILAYCGLELDKCQLKSEAPGYYHPSRSGTIMLGKNILGFFGQIHPTIAQNFDIEVDIVVFELNLSSIPFGKSKLGRKGDFKTSDYQPITRDYAFILDNSQNIIDILNNIKNSDKNLIKNVHLFDIYTGDKIEEGKKSVALSVTIQDDNKTLNEEDINNVNNLILASISKFGGVLRK